MGYCLLILVTPRTHPPLPTTLPPSFRKTTMKLYAKISTFALLATSALATHRQEAANELNDFEAAYGIDPNPCDSYRQVLRCLGQSARRRLTRSTKPCINSKAGGTGCTKT